MTQPESDLAQGAASDAEMYQVAHHPEEKRDLEVK